MKMVLEANCKAYGGNANYPLYLQGLAYQIHWTTEGMDKRVVSLGKLFPLDPRTPDSELLNKDALHLFGYPSSRYVC